MDGAEFCWVVLQLFLSLCRSVSAGLFGPTYPPIQHVAHPDETVISYPGVAFSFNNQLLSRVILSLQPDEEDNGEGDRCELSEAYYKPQMPTYLECMDGDIACAAIKVCNFLIRRCDWSYLI